MGQHVRKEAFFPGALNKRVLQIQKDPEKIDALICEYKPFILAAAQKYTCKSRVTEQDDEYSVALIAFAEAVRSYREDKGRFLPFAKSLIKMRCIDYYRKEKRHAANRLSLDSIDEEETYNHLLYNQSLKQYEEDEAAHLRALEIEQFKKELAGWGISFADLLKVSPKQARTRRLCEMIVRYLTENQEKLQSVFQKKLLPLSDIEKDLRLPRKQLERVRKYIIAVLIIKKGDYPFLNDYVSDWGCEK